MWSVLWADGRQNCIAMASLDDTGFPSGFINIVPGGPSPQVSVIVVSKTALSTIAAPTATSTAYIPVNPASKSSGSRLSTGAIVGISIGVFVEVIISIALVAWYIRKRRAQKMPKKELSEDDGSEFEKS